MLENLLEKNLDLVICGTAVGKKSAEVKQYYAGRGNCFWKKLAEVNLTDRQLQPAEYKLLLTFRIGLTDIVKGQAGNDNEIDFKQNDTAALRENIIIYQPRYLCFNGKTAAKIFLNNRKVDYGMQQEKIGDTILFIAPSTSNSARQYWNLDCWQKLSELIRKY